MDVVEAEEDADAVGAAGQEHEQDPASGLPDPMAVRPGASRGRSSRLWYA